MSGPRDWGCSCPTRRNLSLSRKWRYRWSPRGSQDGSRMRLLKPGWRLLLSSEDLAEVRSSLIQPLHFRGCLSPDPSEICLFTLFRCLSIVPFSSQNVDLHNRLILFLLCLIFVVFCPISLIYPMAVFFLGPSRLTFFFLAALL